MKHNTILTSHQAAVTKHLINPAIAALLLLLASILAAQSAQGTETVLNIPRTAHEAPQGSSSESLAAAITLAAGDNRWQIIDEKPGQLTASTLVRNRHRATINIGYDETHFWIDYLSSENLDYNPKDQRIGNGKNQRQRIIKGPRIHKNYNRWIENLARQITIRMKSPPPVSGSNHSPRLIADELEKLDKLRERGVLSQEEFDHQKKRLLGL